MLAILAVTTSLTLTGSPGALKQAARVDCYDEEEIGQGGRMGRAIKVEGVELKEQTIEVRYTPESYRFGMASPLSIRVCVFTGILEAGHRLFTAFPTANRLAFNYSILESREDKFANRLPPTRRLLYRAVIDRATLRKVNVERMNLKYEASGPRAFVRAMEALLVPQEVAPPRQATTSLPASAQTRELADPAKTGEAVASQENTRVLSCSAIPAPSASIFSMLALLLGLRRRRRTARLPRETPPSGE